jgi:UDP:flavonoid glycosyltransferase YjiC (YdhE family)
VLFASTHGAGHFGPLVPFLDACVRGGHEVLVVGPPTLDARGYPFREGASPPDEELGPLWAGIHLQAPGQAEVIVVGHIFARLNVRAMLPALRQRIEEWRPDLVLREPNEYASALAAEEAGIAHARVGIGLALVEEGALAIAAPALEDERRGIASAIAHSPYLTCWPPSLDRAPFPAARFRAPLAASAHQLPTWWPGDERPLVYITFGSVAGALPTAAAAYERALAAAAGIPGRVLLTTGVELELQPAAPNVHVERWVSQDDVLPHAAAVVCHGGSGTTLGSLTAGVPLVIVPLFADQPWNAVRVAAEGAAVVSSLDDIGRSVERILGDGRYRAAAERLAAEARELPPVDDFLGLF